MTFDSSIVADLELFAIWYLPVELPYSPDSADSRKQNSLFNSALKQSTAVRRDLDTFAQTPGSASPALQGEQKTKGVSEI